jgi:hypothetical protein
MEAVVDRDFSRALLMGSMSRSCFAGSNNTYGPRRFTARSENAVKTHQIWIALSIYVLVAIVKRRLALDVSLYKLLQILSITLFEKAPISRAVFDVGSQFDDIDDGNQLLLFDL